jgi:uncharacterized protein YndB with AHSA1/START domain
MTDSDGTARTWPEYRCRDEAVIPGPIEPVWAAITDLSTYAAWWTLVRITPLDPAQTILAPGVRFHIAGARPGQPPTTGWNVAVTGVVPHERIDLTYTDGDLVGTVSWELAPADGGTSVAYVYHGVRPTHERSAASFERYGSGLHSVAMQVDALAGLARSVAGAPLDDAWRATVAEHMAAGLAALAEPSPRTD